jgi:hypothetical protein
MVEELVGLVAGVRLKGDIRGRLRFGKALVSRRASLGTLEQDYPRFVPSMKWRSPYTNSPLQVKTSLTKESPNLQGANVLYSDGIVVELDLWILARIHEQSLRTGQQRATRSKFHKPGSGETTSAPRRGANISSLC